MQCFFVLFKCNLNIYSMANKNLYVFCPHVHCDMIILKYKYDLQYIYRSSVIVVNLRGHISLVLLILEIGMWFIVLRPPTKCANILLMLIRFDLIGIRNSL